MVHKTNGDDQSEENRDKDVFNFKQSLKNSSALAKQAGRSRGDIDIL
jgi:hypothetical protein